LNKNTDSSGHSQRFQNSESTSTVNATDADAANAPINALSVWGQCRGVPLETGEKKVAELHSLLDKHQCDLWQRKHYNVGPKHDSGKRKDDNGFVTPSSHPERMSDITER
jgi:hypothetical protein